MTFDKINVIPNGVNMNLFNGIERDYNFRRKFAMDNEKIILFMGRLVYEKASISLKKVIGISLIIIFIMGISVMATNTKLNSVKITLSNGYEMNVLTSKTKVSEILDENHIILLQDEKSVPDGDSELSSNKTIRITKTELNKFNRVVDLNHNNKN